MRCLEVSSDATRDQGILIAGADEDGIGRVEGDKVHDPPYRRVLGGMFDGLAFNILKYTQVISKIT